MQSSGHTVMCLELLDTLPRLEVPQPDFAIFAPARDVLLVLDRRDESRWGAVSGGDDAVQQKQQPEGGPERT